MSFQLGGGAAVAHSSGDPTSGIFAVAPGNTSNDGIFQPSGTLTLLITPASGYSLYAQQFTAGSLFEFATELDGIFAGGTPDSFSFQLYDASLSTLLYEQNFDVLQTTSAIPEPSTGMATGIAAVVLGIFMWRRRLQFR